MRKSSQTIAAALVIAAGLVSVVPSASADAAAPAPQQPAALSKLLTAFPGVRYNSWQGVPSIFYGVPMTGADSPAAAAEQWIADYDGAFASGELDLTLDRANEINYGRFNIFVYNQTMDGLPVEMGALRVLVLNAPVRENPSELLHRVVLASARVAARPAGGFSPDAFTAEDAVSRAQQLDLSKALDTWEAPAMCVYFGEGDLDQRVTPVRCWKFAGYSSTDTTQSYTFFVDAATNTIVHARNNVVHADVIGRIRARATPGNNIGPGPTNAPIQRFIPEIRVALVGEAGQAYTDSAGFFRITHTGNTPVTIRTTVQQGHWVEIQDWRGSPGDTDPGLNEIEITRANYAVNSNQITDLSTSLTEQNVAQIDTLLAINQTHTFYRSRCGDWNRIDIRLPARVNLDQTCNASFSSNPLRTNFFFSGDGCANTGWGNVANHEYGHFIVDRLQLGQGAFGEGFSDCMAALINDSPVIGAGFFQDGSAIRHLVNDNVNYPCDGFESHYCGEIIGGVVWEMRQAFGDAFGSVTGLDEVRQLFVDWSQITAGGQAENSAHPDMIAEWLTVDDTDGLFCNGTPHHAQIIAGFAARSIEPTGDPFVEDRVAITVPTPPPAVVNAGTTPTVDVVISPDRGTIVPGSQRMLYRVTREAAWISVPLTHLTGNNYRATLPTLNCTDAVQFHFVVDTDMGSVAFPTPACGGDYYFVRSMPAAEDLADLGVENFETPNADWTESVSPDAVDGRWIRAVPAGSSVIDLVPDQDTTADFVPPDFVPNPFCWVTKDSPRDGAPEDNDVDGGAVILTTPRFDLSFFNDVIVTYNRWFSNGKGTNPFEDTFSVEASDDDGVTWHVAQVVGPDAGPNTVGGWVMDSVFTLNFAGCHPTDAVRFRFIARDDFGDSLVEAAIDDLRFTGSFCQPACDSIDFNRDGLLPDTQDIADFISVFGGGACSTNDCADIDFNNDGLFPDITDIEALINAFAGGPCD